MHKEHSNRQCLICFKDVNHRISMYHLLYQPPICFDCLRQFERIDKTYLWHRHPTYIVYQYNDFFKQLLFQYKGQYDVALKDIFLWTMIPELKRKYREYSIVVIPSSEEDNNKRGFCPNERIVETFSTRIFKGVYKNSNYKQTSQKDRSGIKKVLEIRDGYLLTNQKVLIFDDVMTSGNTILACTDIIAPYHPKSIEILVLSSKHITTLFE